MIEIAGKKIATTLAEIVEPSRTALLIWDMEYAIGPNAFNYQDMLPKLQELAARRRAGLLLGADAIRPRQGRSRGLGAHQDEAGKNL